MGAIDLVYADDVAAVLTHKDVGVLAAAARGYAGNVRGVLDDMGLIISQPKCFNLVVSRGMYTGSLFRRVPFASRGSNMRKSSLDEQLSTRQEF